MLFSLFFTWNPLIFGYPQDGVEQFGFIGAIIFLSIVTYMVVKFKVFGIKLIATQALVWGLVILIGSEFFFIQTTTNKILVAITLIIAAWLGLVIIRSVKKEIEQKEQLAALNINLQNLMKQRESLMHLITHKVKGSFTRTKILFASMLDGTFGEISPEIKKRATQGLDFDNGGLETVDLILNVANMQNGIIKYEMKPINLKDLVEEVISEKKISIEAKGLKIETEIKNNTFDVTGDAFWLKEAVNNLVDNSSKYTKEGSIKVGLEKRDDKILFSVKDTGVGITDEDKKNLFTEGGRGANSIKVNVDSTGYGLYTVKLVIEAHKGRVWAESEGPGKGAQFYIELPVLGDK
jgi:signal transduction histidine kinase